MEKKISLEVIKRLPRYYRYLTELLESGITRISSKELSERMGATASQIRQDLNCFGGFGQQGYGYSVEVLHDAIGEILGLNNHYKTIIVGAGNLGKALAHYKGFEKRGFKLCAIFDIDQSKIGTVIDDLTIQNLDCLEQVVQKERPTIAILTVPKSAADTIAQRLVNCGVKGLLNFCYVDIDVPAGVTVENVHLSDSIMRLAYKISNNL